MPRRQVLAGHDPCSTSWVVLYTVRISRISIGSHSSNPSSDLALAAARETHAFPEFTTAFRGAAMACARLCASQYLAARCRTYLSSNLSCTRRAARLAIAFGCAGPTRASRSAACTQHQRAKTTQSTSSARRVPGAGCGTQQPEHRHSDGADRHVGHATSQTFAAVTRRGAWRGARSGAWALRPATREVT